MRTFLCPKVAGRRVEGALARLFHRRVRVAACSVASAACLAGVLAACGDFQTVSYSHTAGRKPNQWLHLYRPLNRAIFLTTDEDRDGKPEDFVWMSGDPKNASQEAAILFEMRQNTKGQVTRQVWHGPGNLKLVAREDQDGDGFLETTVFYNATARPGVVQGIVARFDVDLNKDGKADAWFFPGARAEFDRDGNGRPDAVVTDAREVHARYEELTKGTLDLKTVRAGTLPPPGSWVLFPDRIPTERHRALLTIPVR